MMCVVSQEITECVVSKEIKRVCGVSQEITEWCVDL